MTEQMISKMINDKWSSDNGIIKFKYYGEFDGLNHLYDDCKNELLYIGNSYRDGAPIFEYNYKGINKNILKDFKSLSIFLRGVKIKHYMKKDMSKKEKSTYSFLNFFMKACENYEVKSPNFWDEIKKDNYDE